MKIKRVIESRVKTLREIIELGEKISEERYVSAVTEKFYWLLLDSLINGSFVAESYEEIIEGCLEKYCGEQYNRLVRCEELYELNYELMKNDRKKDTDEERELMIKMEYTMDGLTSEIEFLQLCKKELDLKYTKTIK